MGEKIKIAGKEIAMGEKIKIAGNGKLVATERLDIIVSHPDGYDIAYTFGEGEEVPHDVAAGAGLLKDQPAQELDRSQEQSLDASKGEEPHTAVLPAPRRSRAKRK